MTKNKIKNNNSSRRNISVQKAHVLVFSVESMIETFGCTQKLDGKLGSMFDYSMEYFLRFRNATKVMTQGCIKSACLKFKLQSLVHMDNIIKDCRVSN